MDYMIILTFSILLTVSASMVFRQRSEEHPQEGHRRVADPDPCVHRPSRRGVSDLLPGPGRVHSRRLHLRAAVLRTVLLAGIPEGQSRVAA